MPQDDSPQNHSSGQKSDRAPPLTRRAPRSRLAIRLIAIPLIGVVAALLYYGLQGCDATIIGAGEAIIIRTPTAGGYGRS